MASSTAIIIGAMNTVLPFLATNRQWLDLARYCVPEGLSSVVITPSFRAL